MNLSTLKPIKGSVKGRKRGRGKGKFRFFIPPSHEDFVGLLYNFMGKGEQGNKHRDFFEKALIKPLNRAYTELNQAKQSIAKDYKGLIKKMPDKPLSNFMDGGKDLHSLGKTIKCLFICSQFFK